MYVNVVLLYVFVYICVCRSEYGVCMYESYEYVNMLVYSVCMYVCMNVCIYECEINRYAYTHTNTNIYVRIYRGRELYICMCVCIYVCMYVCMFIYICMRMYVCMIASSSRLRTLF